MSERLTVIVNSAFWLFVALCAVLLIASNPLGVLGYLLAVGLMLGFAAFCGLNWRNG